jgi:hypothetical protein
MKEKLNVLQELIDKGLELDLFYNVSLDSNGIISLQGDMRYETVKLLGEKYGVVLQNETDSGFLRGSFDHNGTKVRFVLS